MMHAGVSSPTSMVGATEWRKRQRRREESGSAYAETDDDVHSVSSRSQWQPDAADVEMMHSLSVVEALPVGRMAVSMSMRNNRRSIKRMKVVDLQAGALGGDGLGGPAPAATTAAAFGAASVAPFVPADGLGSLGGAATSMAAMGAAAAGASGSSGANISVGSSSSADASMFTEFPLVAPSDEHTGSALLCFLSQDTFVGFVELEEPGTKEQHVLKLTGSESLTECDRALCAVQDCCGDKAFLVTAQTCAPKSEPITHPNSRHGRRKRTYLARSSGVGDYVAFEGRGMRFQTDFVPGDEQRDQVLGRHFGMLPRSARRDSVLCLGQMTLHWKGLGRNGEAAEDGGLGGFEAAESARLVASQAREEHEGYAGDKSGAESSGDEHEVQASMRSILPMLAGVAMPTPKPITYEDLVARGGTPIDAIDEDNDDWL